MWGQSLKVETGFCKPKTVKSEAKKIFFALRISGGIHLNKNNTLSFDMFL